MYENKTFEDILSDMLSYVRVRYPEMDLREGSFMYTSLAPMALEMETFYREMSMTSDNTFVETASTDYLMKHGDQMGVEMKEATYGHFKGDFDVDVSIGSRFNLDEFNYNVISKLSDPTSGHPYYTFELVCETSGSKPNGFLGDLTPITFVANLTYAKLTEVIIYGEDDEDTEIYRDRIQRHAKNPPVNGNVAQYDEWLTDYDGVGAYKIIPCWNGINTVKLVVLDVENQRASEELLEDVQNYFDPPTATINDDTSSGNYPQGRGMGNGQAPIGSIVTVDSVTEVPVTVNCKVVLNQGYTTPVGVQEAVKNYLSSIVFNKTSVAYMPISAEIYNTDSVKDIVSLTITVNGTVMDTEVSPFVDSVKLNDNEIAVLDTENSVWSV